MPVLKYKDGNEWKVASKNVAYEKDNTLFKSMVDRSITEVKVEDLQGITSIGREAFDYCAKLTSIELPDSIITIRDYAFSNCSLLKTITIPENVVSLGNNAFSSCFSLKTITIPKNVVSLGDSAFSNCRDLVSIYLLNKDTTVTLRENLFLQCYKLQNIYVPAKLLNEYINKHGMYINQLKPYDYWIPEITNQIMLFNNTKTITIELINYNETPTYSITSSNTDIATISNINATNTAITFDITTLSTEGDCNINISVSNNDITYDRSFKLTVYEAIPESTYTVSAIDGAKHGFSLNNNGYYESTNNGMANSYSLCRVNISNPAGKKLYFDCISYGESNYDFGILGAVNQELVKSEVVDSGVKKSFKGLSKPTVQTVEYTDATGDCFIDVKYRKDGSGDQGNDSLQFKVRFEEV